MNARGSTKSYEAADARVWLMHGARRAAVRDDETVQEAVGAISEIAASVGRVAVGREIAAVVTGTLPYLFESGWQPAEVVRAVRRRGSGRLEGLLVTALADDSGWNPKGHRPPPAWTAQLETLGVDRWWGPDADWIDPWARRAGLTWTAAVKAVIEMLGIISLVPKLEVIVPPPKSWDGVTVLLTGVVVDGAVLATVRALLAKAESTSFEAEAEALTAKAQQLMARHAIDEAVARSGRHDPSERPSARRTPVDDPYASARSSLLHVVARANGVRSVWYPDQALMALIGFDRDLDAVEVLYTSLLVQATRSMVAAGQVSDRRGHSRTRSFRQSFLIAFASRIGERLSEAASAARDEAEEELGVALLPVLARRDDDVQDATDQMFPRLRRAAGPSASNPEGWRAGRTAAELADLGPGAALEAG
jgi:hypothetical protein